MLAFPIEGMLPFFWVAQEGVQKRARSDRVPYPARIEGKLIEATDGAVIDFDVIRARINALSEVYRIREVAVDRWNATQLATQLTGDGFEVFAFGQGFASTTGPAKDLERRIFGRTVNHAGNPVLRWMAANVAVEMDAAGNIKPSKARSTERIDGIVAALMALGRVISNQETGPDRYASEGFAFV